MPNKSKVIALIATLAISLIIIELMGGGRARKERADLVRVDYIPSLRTNLFYDRDSLLFCSRLAYLDDDPVALCVVGTSSYHLNYFDKAAGDSLSAVPLDEADIMLLRSAEKGYAHAYLNIHYFDQLGLWTRTVPDCNYDSLVALYKHPCRDGFFPLVVKH